MEILFDVVRYLVDLIFTSIILLVVFLSLSLKNHEPMKRDYYKDFIDKIDSFKW